jgi:hypothetical protein
MSAEHDIEMGLMERVGQFATFFVRSDVWADDGIWYDGENLTENFVYAPETPYLVAYPNIPFPPVDHPEYVEQLHLEALHFRNNHASDLSGTEKRLRGILQMTLIDPGKTGFIGDSPGIYIAGAVAAFFHKNTRIQYAATMIKITNTPDCLTPFTDGGKRHYPVSIPYSVFAR